MELGNIAFGHSRGLYEVKRNMGYEETLNKLFHFLKCSSYGIHFENEIFEMHPYCWCEQDNCLQCGTGEQVNFWYKPDNLKIRWYKYSLRDSYSNKKFNLKYFNDIIEKCINSLEGVK